MRIRDGASFGLVGSVCDAHNTTGGSVSGEMKQVPRREGRWVKPNEAQTLCHEAVLRLCLLRRRLAGPAGKASSQPCPQLPLFGVYGAG